jgi:two-component system sensor histidine kinase CreC
LGNRQKNINHRIYITDKQGIVIADSWQQDVGKDYSQWNDVYLTLRGQYGARSTKEDPNNPLTSVMHVAAPIYHNGIIIGSVTVAKSNRSTQPFIDLSKRNVLFWMVLMSGLVLLTGALFAWRIHSALQKLEYYATKIGQGEKASKPKFRIFYEYATLSDALEKMRNQLDGKRYVEEYVQTLTHELKSPLSAIKGASEILQTPLSGDKFSHFARNIERESDRMQALIDKLLDLARLEKRPALENLESIALREMITDVVHSVEARLCNQSIITNICIDEKLNVLGDIFLVKQAAFNLMDNALDFVHTSGTIEWYAEVEQEHIHLSIFNTGPHIPDYAVPRLTERFYSLARENGSKSTGLGLNFVEQIVKLHKGTLRVENINSGVKVIITLATP